MGDDNGIGRVCSYTRQQCGLEAGCLVFKDGVTMGMSSASIEFQAMQCAAGGKYLFADELLRMEWRGENCTDKQRSSARAGHETRLVNQLLRRQQAMRVAAEEQEVWELQRKEQQ